MAIRSAFMAARASSAVLPPAIHETTRPDASSNSDTIELEPIVLSERTSATSRARAHSASPRLPVTVAVRWRRLPLSGLVPA